VTSARIAIVDDDPLFVEYLASTLKSRGYDVRTYSGGAELIAALGSADAPEVVLLDVLMPAMNGLETLRTLRTNHPTVQVVMLSGQQVPGTIVDAVRSGAVDYVVKPDDPGGMGEAAIENAIIKALETVALHTEVARLNTAAIEPADGAQASWGTGAAMQQVMTMIDRVADSDVSVLISGESGVGKEVIARELHRRSPRRSRPFVKVNCAALPADLLESEMFGHERGAFTGAQASRIGKFEYADGGTLMLDEIGEMPPGLQAKLLHVLQDREFAKVGSNRPVTVDVRVIAATNRNLESMMQTGQFREDLYYRLQVIEVRGPPLRERPDEIPLLTVFFLRRYATRYGRPLPRPSAALRDLLVRYPWPGNVRELENTIKRFVILQDEASVRAELQRTSTKPTDAAAPASFAPTAPPPATAAPAMPPQPPAPAYTESPDYVTHEPVVAPPPVASRPEGDATRSAKLPDVARAAALSAEREAICLALDKFRWNRRKAARQLGVSYKTLLNKMKACGISAPPETSMVE
jgi:two-component system response regulator AtoC